MKKNITLLLLILATTLNANAAKVVEITVLNKAGFLLTSEVLIQPEDIVVASKSHIEPLILETFSFTVPDHVEEIKIRNKPEYSPLGICNKLIDLEGPVTRIKITSTSTKDWHLCGTEYY